MEQKPIPEWVKSKDFVDYREFILMDKDTILKRSWEKQDKLHNSLKASVSFIIILGLLAILLELLWLGVI